MKKGQPFAHEDSFEANKVPLLAFHGINSPEESLVWKVVVHFPKGGTDQDLDHQIFIHEEGRYWSMAFCQYFVQSFQIPVVADGEGYCYRTPVTEEMIIFAETFFNLPSNHGGFYTAFLNAESIEIYMPAA